LSVDQRAPIAEGFSARLPWPASVLAQAGWDSGTFWGRRWARALPPALVQGVSGFAERVQRPALAVWSGTTSERLRVAYAGNDGALAKLLFTALGVGPVESSGSVRASEAPEFELGADLEFVEVSALRARTLARAGWLMLPRWVEFEVDLRQREAALWDARKREIVRRIERSALTLEIGRDEAAAAEFHRDMYTPTARERHGDRAFVRRLGYVRRAARSGYVVFARSGVVRVAGLLLVPRRGSAGVDAWLFGVRDGAYAESRLAREAVYLFALRWARDELGVQSFGLTASPPLLCHGLTRFKKRWGATAAPGLRHGTAIAVRLRTGSPELSAALGLQPLIGLSWKADSPALAVPLPWLAGGPRRALPETPGVEIHELLLERPSELPHRLEEYTIKSAI
jgi:hypothetical protein